MADIVARAKGLIMQPAQEWRAIAAEPADTGSLILGYAAPLSLIPTVVGLIAAWLLGAALLPRIGIGSLLLHGVARYILGLAALWVIGKLIQTLAPKFGGVDDEVSAMKLSVYSPTASWLASIFMLIPIVGLLFVLVGLIYSIYLFYTGAPVVVRIPANKVLPFTITVAICAIVLFVLVGWVIASLLPWF